MKQIPTRVKTELAAVTGENANDISDSFERDVRTSIRLNRKKFEPAIKLDSVPWCASGYFLPERPTFVTDPLFHGGAYYVQESSSMFLEQVFNQFVSKSDPLLALDLCGAPGGKSTHLLSLLSEDSVLISNEVIRTRANILSENITKWGFPNQAVINSDPKFIGESNLQFDLMVVDAPCSGEGLFRRDPEAIEQWSEENVTLCAARQKRILADVWPALKPGGILIYSTCTFNRSENEDNLVWMREQFDLESLRLTSIHESVVETETGGLFAYRFVPTRSLGEGFFMTAVRKMGSVDQRSSKPDKTRITNLKSSAASEFLKTAANTKMVDLNGAHHLITNQMETLLSSLVKLRPVSIGTELGRLKGKDFIPSQALANSIHFDSKNHCIELSLEQALTFLSLGQLLIEAPKGWHAVSFQGVVLGFIKSLGNRCNTYFPKEWRIRTDLAKYPKPFFSLGNFLT